jgi:hypothetical protein
MLIPFLLLPNEVSSVRLSHWMSDSSAFLYHTNIWNLTLPGTHDSLAYDLTSTVDPLTQVAWLGNLHLVTGKISHLAETQTLSITEQLDNGIRFLDIRVTFLRQENLWYGNHYLITQHEIFYYFNQIREWLDSHEGEVIVIWISQHGEPESELCFV